MKKSTSWFTFGQCHTHSYNGRTVDKDTVIQITAKDPREVMVELFGIKWSMEYFKCPDLFHYPKGIVEIER